MVVLVENPRMEIGLFLKQGARLWPDDSLWNIHLPPNATDRECRGCNAPFPELSQSYDEALRLRRGDTAWYIAQAIDIVSTTTSKPGWGSYLR